MANLAALRSEVLAEVALAAASARFMVAVLAELSLVYVAACIVAAWRWQRRVISTPPGGAGTEPDWPSVAILKPLCGMEPALEDNLRSFCDQQYPAFEVLMGARNSADLALTVAERVAAQSRGRAQVVPGARPLGANQKINTLAHLGAQATPEVVVMSDSDIGVGPGYLAAVVTPLLDPRVGIVTCLYRGVPVGSLWSRLGALGINEWFLPSVLLSRALGSEAYCSGSTMAIRRNVLEAIGGFAVLAPRLADDHELGARIRRLGLRNVVSHYEVATTVDEPSLGTLIQHELRWMRTIRTVHPVGHAFSVITYALPMTLLCAAMLMHRQPWALGLPAVAIALRL